MKAHWQGAGRQIRRGGSRSRSPVFCMSELLRKITHILEGSHGIIYVTHGIKRREALFDFRA